MTLWILTVWLSYGEINKIYLEEKFHTEEECRQWQAFYNEYPFRPQCTKLKGKV